MSPVYRRAARCSRQLTGAEAAGVRCAATSGELQRGVPQVELVVFGAALGGEERSVAAGVQHARLEPGERAVEHLLRRGVVAVVGVGPQPREVGVDAAAGLPAEQVGELDGARLPVLGQHLRADDAGAHREQLRPDVDDAAEERLLLLQPALPAAHAVERRAGELAGRPLHEAQVLGEHPELGERARRRPGADRELRQPGRVEAGGPHRGPGLGGQRDAGLDDVAGHGEVLVDRLAGDEQLHDLARALEDAVDPHVPQHLLGRHRPLAARRQRLGGLVAAAAADLHHLVDDQPAHLAGPQLGDRGLDADVLAALVGHVTGQLEDGLQPERGRGDERDLLRDRVVLTHRAAPLHPRTGPLAGRSAARTSRFRRRSRAARADRR